MMSGSAATLTTMESLCMGKSCQRNITNAALITSVVLGDLGKATLCLDEGASPNASCQGSEISVCHLAAFLDAPDILQLLISRGGDALTRPDKRGRSPLHLAAWQGNYNCVATLLKQPRSDKRTIQEEASPAGLQEFVPRITAPRLEGTNPADQMFSTFGLNILVKETIAKIEKVWCDKSAVQLAAARCQPQVLDLLLKATTCLLDRDKVMASALLTCGMAFMANLHECSLDRYSATINLFEKHGLSDTYKHFDVDAHEDSSFHVAVMLDSEPPICSLLRMNFWPILMNAEGDTPIHLAIKQKKEKSLTTIYQYWRNPDVEIKNINGHTPLMLATVYQWPEAVCFLLEREASIASLSGNLPVPLELLTEVGIQKFEDYLRRVRENPYLTSFFSSKKVDKLTPLLLAIVYGFDDIAFDLIRKGASCGNTRSLTGVSALHMAAWFNRPNILECVINCIKSKCDENELKTIINRLDKDEMAALHLAADSVDCTKLLLNVGADVRLKGGQLGSTALHMAVMNNNCQTALLILTQDIEAINDKDRTQLTPFQKAASIRNRELTRLFLFHGVNFLASPIEFYKFVDLIIKHVPRPMELLLEWFESKVMSYENPHDANFVIINYSCLLLTEQRQVGRRDLEQSKSDIHFKVKLERAREEFGLKVLPASKGKLRDADWRQMYVLHIFMSCCGLQDQKTLLLHPYVEAFLRVKWSRMWILYLPLLLLRYMFALAYTGLTISLYGDQHATDAHHFTVYIVTFKALVAVFVACVLVMKGMELMVSRRSAGQLGQPGSCWRSLLVPAVLLLSTLSLCLAQDSLWLRLVCCVNILLVWFEATSMLAFIPSVGYFFQIFSMVASRVIKVLILFGLVLMASFGLLFWMIFGAQEPFESPYQAIAKAFVMMTAEFDYDDMFGQKNKFPASVYLAQLVLLLYIIMVPIVMMNLLLALAVSDTNNLSEEGRVQRLREQVQAMAWYENMCFSFWPGLVKKTCIRQNLVIYKPDPLNTNNSSLSQRIVDSLYACVQNKVKSDESAKLIEELKKNVAEMKGEIAALVDIIKYKHSECGPHI